jgi:hypothetical protein
LFFAKIKHFFLCATFEKVVTQHDQPAHSHDTPIEALSEQKPSILIVCDVAISSHVSH